MKKTKVPRPRLRTVIAIKDGQGRIRYLCTTSKSIEDATDQLYLRAIKANAPVELQWLHSQLIFNKRPPVEVLMELTGTLATALFQAALIANKNGLQISADGQSWWYLPVD